MPQAPLTIEIHPNEFPSAARAAVLGGLRAGRIPGRFLYQSDAQAQRWLEYHQAFSPSRVDHGVRDLYRSAFQAAVAALNGQALHGRDSVAVSLGCGGGQKDGDLFDQVPAASRPRWAYVPLDTSAALVLEAMLHVTARHPSLRTHPLVIDLQAEPDLGPWLDARTSASAGRLFCAFGLLPNLDPVALLAYLRRLLREGDALLLSANQSPHGLAADGSRILAQYDNTPAHAWYLGAVESLGIPGSAVDLKIGTVSQQPDGGWWRIDVTVVPHEGLNVRLHGETVTLPAGQPVTLFHSHRFTPAALRTRLAAAHLTIVQSWEGAGGEEGILLLKANS